MSEDNSEIYLLAETFLLKEISKIIKARWKEIEQTTSYEWLSILSYGEIISQKDTEVLSMLAKKIGFEGCQKSLNIIRKWSNNFHPKHVPVIAIIVLQEIYIAELMLLKKQSKYLINQNIRTEDRLCKIFTISDII